MASRHDRRWGLGAFWTVVLFGSVSFARCAFGQESISADRNGEGAALFESDVRGLLEKHCLECHGGEKVEGDFDLTTRESLLESGMLGDNAASSRLFELITHSDEPAMPKDAPKLSDDAIDKVRRWLDHGAPYDRPLIDRGGPHREARGREVTDEDRDHWAFRRLQTVAPPAVSAGEPVRSPIDAFLRREFDALGIAPPGRADRRTLIRRAALDLIGLPPTPDEIDAFVADRDPRAYERLVDRLLASPGYGERWARHWMDIARFAESHGYEQDYDRPTAYPYRDFLIKAFDADLPYDRFVQWQIAGDELAPDHSLAITATGFLGAGPFPTQLTEAEFESARYDELDDMVSTVGSAFLGLSIGCARCHAHKFDPIPSADYYAMAAVFATTIRAEVDYDPAARIEEGGEAPAGAAPRAKALVATEGLRPLKHHADDRGFPHFYADVHFLARGDVRRKTAVAPPGYLRVLMRDGYGSDHWRVTPPEGWNRTSFRRAALANWLTDVEHGAGPLAARVIVNRIWLHHFGRGLVATPSDFGKQGDPPTHPELLEWLARDLVANGWRLKRIHRAIMTSEAYTRSSGFDEGRASADPDNRSYWRFVPRRLEGETIRDAMLAVSGLLDPTPFGPASLDPAMRRRSVYFFIKRSELIPTMMLFDWPEHLVGIGRRARTTTAPQALAFLNNPRIRSYAEGLASRVEPRAGGERIDEAYRLCFGRRPDERERGAAAAFLADQSAAYADAGESDAERRALVDYCQTLFCTNEFAYLP